MKFKDLEVGNKFKFSPNGIFWKVIHTTKGLFLNPVIQIESENGSHRTYTSDNPKWEQEVIEEDNSPQNYKYKVVSWDTGETIHRTNNLFEAKRVAKKQGHKNKIYGKYYLPLARVDERMPKDYPYPWGCCYNPRFLVGK